MYNPVNGENKDKFTNSANKAYLHIKTNGISFYGFRFDDDSTSLENIETDCEEKIIYDLSGRKITEITEKGIYIVNGKKIVY